MWKTFERSKPLTVSKSQGTTPRQDARCQSALINQVCVRADNPLKSPTLSEQRGKNQYT